MWSDCDGDIRPVTLARRTWTVGIYVAKARWL